MHGVFEAQQNELAAAQQRLEMLRKRNQVFKLLLVKVKQPYRLVSRSSRFKLFRHDKVRKKLGPTRFHLGAYLVVYTTLKEKLKRLDRERKKCLR